MCVAPEAPGAPICRSSVAPENATIAISRTACTRLFASVLIVLDVTADAAGTPWRWKNRTAIARPPKLVGTARLR